MTFPPAATQILEFGYIISFCSCRMNLIRLQEKDGISHHCSARLSLQGQFTASRLDFVRCHFPPLHIDKLGSLTLRKHWLAIWPVSRL